ncbi:bifunctional diaminohydroxyphosphoribosylaminopyrimidine deaminase/5-amino-6-(5-phosphoribosylamino)uracil reductase RibD [Hydrogenimonas urashimensis]|uniref:bifunctional diaminohydroxyphosphoribosylaminopyrimidine deaminase/5-amino-6-(5-phosphoribosylamino)uracil reductase RibD n=1 Tax=Hydrogenimonas urashimensis TaxID=2740515 RepID=UPI00191612E4|nr:bifunctional diaminohydroxyphosphoribosylaminopyrimidine deaminase/5-amino-6-(5-phosphoribosylamino)uracil reductase RibD [Hydrogenimonas urashimensis]
MSLALHEAWKYQLLTYPNPAVGAVITDGHGALLAVAAHREAGKAHAEILAIRDAYGRLTGDRDLAVCDDALVLHDELSKRAETLFRDATLYVTLEPCSHTGRTPACAGLIERLGFRRVIIGAMDPNPEAAGGAKRLQKAGIDVATGVEKEACEALLEPFVKWQRGRFVFFKLAQSLNGVIDGGTISSEASRRWVHAVRTKIDRLVIGGGTVRIDRPILDSRLVKGKAPDVAIFTRHPQSIDRTIPLFDVPGRQVSFGKTLPEKGLVMIEGGPGAFAALRDEIDWMVLFIAPFVKEGMGYNATRDFWLLHQRRSGDDAMLWLKSRDQ